MASKFGKSLLLIVLALVALKAWSAAPIVDLVIGDQESVKELTLLNKVKDLALGVLTYILAPVAGAFTSWKGWQMIGNSDRGDKGQGIIVFLSGIGMFALPAGILGSAFVEEYHSRRETEAKPVICPHCGLPIDDTPVTAQPQTSRVN